MATAGAPAFPTNRPLNAGGSISGLLHGLVLRNNGHNVTILEQSPKELEHQAAGIVPHPLFKTLLNRLDRSGRPLSRFTHGIRTISIHDKIIEFTPLNTNMNSWDAIYYRLRWNFDVLLSPYNPEAVPENDVTGQQGGSATYRKGHRLMDFEVGGDGIVTVDFEDTVGETKGKLSADLLISTDGANSTVRQKFLLSAPPRRYVGYVLWRGVAQESDLSPKTRALFEKHFTFLVLGGQYVVVYHIPGRNGSLVPGECLLNFAWYTCESADSLASIMTDRHGKRHHWTMPRGLMRDDVWAAQQHLTSRTLSPVVAELAARISDPFLQVISECHSPRAAFYGGRVLLVSDALSQLRPHTGKGILQAATHCILVEKLVKGDLGVREWERRCLEAGWLNRLEAVSWTCYYFRWRARWLVATVRFRLATRWCQVRDWWLG